MAEVNQNIILLNKIMENFDSDGRYIPERSKINHSLTFERSFRIRSFARVKNFHFQQIFREYYFKFLNF